MSQIIPLNPREARMSKLPPDWLLIEPDFSGKYIYTVDPDPTPRNIVWHVVQNRVVLIPSDTLNTLTEKQKIRMFTPILALKRLDSEHSQRFFSSCIHITTDGSLTISENTDRQASEMHKDCAEMNALGRIKNIAKNKIEQTYIMVGFHDKRNQSSPSTGTEKAFCPCGKCIDSLAKNMTDAASIAVIPACDGMEDLPISRVQDYRDLKPSEIWSTNIGVLNRHYKLSLNASETFTAQEAKRVITSPTEWRDRVSAPVRHLHSAVGSVMNAPIIKKAPEGARRFIRASFNPDSPDNKKHELEADPSPATINNFRINEIAHAYHSLKEAVHRGELIAIPDDLKIRCLVTRMSDGSFDSAVEVRGKGISAVTAAETTLTTAAQRSHTSITDCWAMEMDLQDIDNGKIHTSQKEGLERLFKRISKNLDIVDIEGKPIRGSMNLHYTVLNLGSLKSEAVEKLTHTYKIEDIFPSGFQGVKRQMNERPAPQKGR